MSTLAGSFLAMILSAAPANPMLEELVDRGIGISDGSFVKLSPPFMPDGLDAAAQRAVIDKLAAPDRTFADLAQRSFQAPVVVNIRTVATKNEGFVRVVDAGFVAYGDWDRLRSSEFLEGLLRSAKQEKDPQDRPGVVSDAELAKRNVKLHPPQGLEEQFFFSAVNLLDRVQVSSTRRSIGHRAEDWLVLAAKIDPRFNRDPDFPDQWCPLGETADGRLVPGKPTPYTASGFYVKVVRLAEPAGALFIEHHLVFEEPYGWFKGGPQLRSKLPLLIQDEVRSLRRRLAQPPPGAKP